MDKQRQDQAWACLPKEVRAQIRSKYENSVNMGLRMTFDNIFGHHNLTSDTEPEEVFILWRKDVQETYAYNEQILKHDPTHRGALMLREYLKRTFGDKCLPDTPNTPNSGELESESAENKPKFKVGDKVRVIGKWFNGIVAEITNVDEDDPDATYQIDNYAAWDEGAWFSDEELEPYTESETTRKKPQDLSLSDNQKNDMEEKELNLCELLKGCEGEKIFSITRGEVLLHEIKEQKGSNRPIRIRKDDNVYYRCANGKCGSDGLVGLYPSEELLRKYPLDAKKAWSEWAESRKPKRWTPQIGERIFWVNANLTVSQDVFNDYETQRKRRSVGNEFKTGKEAQQAADEVRKCLESYHARKENDDE